MSAPTDPASNIFDEIGLNPDDLDRNVYGRMVKTLIQAALPDADRFEAASVAAEGWLNTVAAVAHLSNGPEPNVDAAYRLLMPAKDEERSYNLLESYGQHAEVLRQRASDLSQLGGRDVVLKPFAPGEFPLRWHSAHQAAAGIARLALEQLVAPIAGMTDPEEQFPAAGRLLAAWRKQFVLSPARVASLCSRIRRERAKVLRQPPPGREFEGGGQPAEPAAKSGISLDAKALAVFIEHPDWTKKTIASHLACNEKSLTPKRCPKLAAAIAAHKSPIDPGRRRLRGSKDADGNLEAWEEE
jgi:hypothetical protein